jgi:hypothetical protein
LHILQLDEDVYFVQERINAPATWGDGLEACKTPPGILPFPAPIVSHTLRVESVSVLGGAKALVRLK